MLPSVFVYGRGAQHNSSMRKARQSVQWEFFLDTSAWSGFSRIIADFDTIDT